MICFDSLHWIPNLEYLNHARAFLSNNKITISQKEKAGWARAYQQCCEFKYKVVEMGLKLVEIGRHQLSWSDNFLQVREHIRAGYNSFQTTTLKTNSELSKTEQFLQIYFIKFIQHGHRELIQRRPFNRENMRGHKHLHWKQPAIIHP